MTLIDLFLWASKRNLRFHFRDNSLTGFKEILVTWKTGKKTIHGHQISFTEEEIKLGGEAILLYKLMKFCSQIDPIFLDYFKKEK